MISKLHPFTNRPHNPTLPHPPTSSSFARTFTITATTRQQEIRISNGLSWRQKTSMPIIKVLNFTSQKAQHQNGTHTTCFKVQMEQIVKSITDLRNLDISYVVYLVREILLGIQTLCIKYNCQFETSKAFFGVNDKGQAKVWFSDNFANQYVQNFGKSMSFSVNKVNSVVQSVFEIVGRTVKHNQKTILHQIGSLIYKQQHTTFAQAQNKFRKICAQFKILVPNCIALPLENNNQNKRTLISTQKKFRRVIPVLKQYGINLKNIPTKTITNQQLFHNQATRNTSGLNSPKTDQHHVYTQQRVQPALSRPKINWRYTNSAHTNQQSINESMMNNQQVYKIETVNNSINRNSVANSLHGSAHKQIMLCRSVPIKIDPHRMNSEQRRLLGKQAFREDITIKQFNPLEEEDQSLEVSRNTEQKMQTNVIENSNVYTLKSAKTAETKNQDESKISFEGCSSVIENFNSKKSNATTNVSNNTLSGKDSIRQFKEKCYNVNRLEEMIDNTKTVVNSIMIPSPLESRQAPVSSRTYYNFGGIIPIQINAGIEIDGKQTESLQASRDVQLKESIQVKQQKKSKIDFDLLGGIDLMAKFYATDAKDLKESVWCGEEKKAEHLHIKLQKLGKIGREICASFVPNE